MSAILTDLEGAALAEIIERGSATSYAIAKSFAASPSEFWSGSEGAVYPMLKRLEKRGLLRADMRNNGRRMQIDYSITNSGRTAVEGWLLDAKRAAGMGFDPLRARLTHLGIVSPERRQCFLEEVRECTAAIANPQGLDDDPVAQKVMVGWGKFRLGWIKQLGFLCD